MRQGASADKLQGYNISYPSLDLPDPNKAQSTVGTVLSISTAPMSHMQEAIRCLQYYAQEDCRTTIYLPSQIWCEGIGSW